LPELLSDIKASPEAEIPVNNSGDRNSSTPFSIFDNGNPPVYSGSGGKYDSPI
jgi:hypothetical protein